MTNSSSEKYNCSNSKILLLVDIVDCLKNLHSQNLRLRTPTRVNVPSVDLNNIQVPVIVTGASNGRSFS